MSNLLKHWFSTNSDSVIKSISSKPLHVTTRDAVIVTALTLAATLIIMFIYFNVTNTAQVDRKYRDVAVKTIATSMLAQYLYEYSGTNNMIAESSIRYAKGSTLSKYVSKRRAFIYECLHKLIKSPKYKKIEPQIMSNFDILEIMVTDPGLCGSVADYIMGVISETHLRAKYPKKSHQIDKILSLPRDVIIAGNTIGDTIVEPMAYDILVNGFNNYTLTDTLFKTIDNPAGMRAGEQIARELNEIVN